MFEKELQAEIDQVINNTVLNFINNAHHMCRAIALRTPGMEGVSTGVFKKRISELYGAKKAKPQLSESVGKRAARRFVAADKGLKKVRDYSRWMVDGDLKPRSKATASMHIIKKLVGENPNVTPTDIQGRLFNIGVRVATWADEIPQNEKTRWHQKPEQLLNTSSGRQIALSTQWTRPEFDKLVKLAKKSGISVEKSRNTK